jgi:hypothetical protein
MGRRSLTPLALCSLLVSAGACQEGQQTGTPGTTQPVEAQGMAQEVAPPVPGSGTGVTALRWTTPPGWVAEAPSSAMRKAQYRVPGQAGDAECIVFYFGPGQGGDAMANAERWAAQFTLPDGRPGSAGVQIRHRKVNEIDVLTVEIAGTYQGGFRMQQPKPAPIPNYMLLGAIAEGPDANWFFKLAGPEATVEGQRAAFEDLVGSFKRGG